MMQRPWLRVMLLMSATLLWLAGCGGESNPRKGVSGNVVFEGKPLDQGRIHFSPATSGSSEGGATITEGKYSIPADVGLLPGSYKVAIFSYDQKGKKVESTEIPGDPGANQFRERIPAKYNSETTLKADVQEKGPNTFDFKLD